MVFIDNRLCPHGINKEVSGCASCNTSLGGPDSPKLAALHEKLMLRCWRCSDRKQEIARAGQVCDECKKNQGEGASGA